MVEFGPYRECAGLKGRPASTDLRYMAGLATIVEGDLGLGSDVAGLAPLVLARRCRRRVAGPTRELAVGGVREAHRVFWFGD